MKKKNQQPSFYRIKNLVQAVLITASVFTATRLLNAEPASICSQKISKAKISTMGVNKDREFGIEYEFYPENSPMLVEHYRTPEIDETDWFGLSEDARREQIKKAFLTASKKNQLVLVATTKNPSGIQSSVRYDTTPALEVNDQSIQSDSEKSIEQVLRLRQQIGPGFLHAHISQPGKIAPNPGLLTFIKFDYDITQAESLAKSYSVHTKKPEVKPGRNLSNRSIAPLDETGFSQIKDAIFSGNFDPRAKFYFAIVPRQGIYGEGRSGFEVRNCHPRKGCLVEKYSNFIAFDDSNFQSLKHFSERGDLASNRTLNSLPPELSKLFKDLGSWLRSQNESKERNDNYDLRFLFPFLNWDKHPLIHQLDSTTQNKFSTRHHGHLNSLITRLTNIAQDESLSADQKIEAVEIAESKWAHDTDLSSFLKMGLQTLRP